MNDTDKPEEQPKHPADALAEMADREPDEAPPAPSPPDHVEALSQLAEGEPPADDQGDSEPPEPEAVDEQLAQQTNLAGEDAFRARQARRASIGAHEARAGASIYKKAMIPLLVVVGVLLLLVGVLSVMLLMRHGSEGAYGERLVVVALVSFPLAAVLIFGACWFHRDVSAK